MKFIRVLAPLGLSAIVTLGLVASFSTPAIAQTKQACHMKGWWTTATGEGFEFDAAYVYNHGEDDFTGVYRNPAQGTEANVTGAARGGTWNILLSYVDAKSMGWSKKLVGTGAQDPVTHALTVTGTFQEFRPGTAAPIKTGPFLLAGQCH
jgi:hypothetical protein